MKRQPQPTFDFEVFGGMNAQGGEVTERQYELIAQPDRSLLSPNSFVVPLIPKEGN